ncbi:hypothetical protein CRG98_010302 [Punica granatum]|uniref:Uncharacterized protein n=1 Tax=Punica granatum TaxID=22663 RepID=A0A2I0KLB8_PUNGR|nr:hypothetical protein CRG98_010302 [Punica granatum]
MWEKAIGMRSIGKPVVKSHALNHLRLSPGRSSISRFLCCFLYRAAASLGATKKTMS